MAIELVDAFSYLDRTTKGIFLITNCNNLYSRASILNDIDDTGRYYLRLI